MTISHGIELFLHSKELVNACIEAKVNFNVLSPVMRDLVNVFNFRSSYYALFALAILSLSFVLRGSPPLLVSIGLFLPVLRYISVDWYLKQFKLAIGVR